MEPSPKQPYSAYVPDLKTIKEIAVECDANRAKRPSMEDGYFIQDNFQSDGKTCVFGVVDGHGGYDVTAYLTSNFPSELGKQYKRYKTKLEEMFKQTFLGLDNQIKLFCGAGDLGATACLAYVTLNEKSEKVLYVANIGDTRAVMSSDKKAVRLSMDHKASEPLEIERVTKSNGIIAKNRLGGQLAVTRAFGDFELKSKGLTAEPTVTKTVLSERDQYLIIASDGLWDTIEDQPAVDLISPLPGPKEMAAALLKHALTNGSTDNISVMVVKLA